MTVTDWDFPTAEQLEASAKRARESTALWLFGDVYYENELMWREIIARAKEGAGTPMNGLTASATMP
jgi:hypothetical protein